MSRASRILPFVVAALVACEEDEETVESPQEICAEGGGEWSSGDCGGAQDRCDLVACEHVIGEGCRCPDYACWDGTSCVSDPRSVP